MKRQRRRLNWESLEPRLLLDASPMISEFMAINNSVVADEDGDFVDWVELHNPGTQPIDLSGWYLTDDADDLTKWQFPAVTLPARGYQVVFASDKDRTDPASNLHANFRLSGSGEFLALVDPDGNTVADAYDPEFPGQIDDLSYGALSVPESAVLAGEGDTIRAFVPSDDSLGSAWVATDYDDSGWLSGTSGVGYDLDEDLPAEVGIDLAGTMAGVNSSAYVRMPFEISDPELLLADTLSLGLKYDDGFIAYLNGQPVLARNAPGGGDSPASGLVAYYPLDGTLADAAGQFLNNSGATDNNLTSAGPGAAQFVAGQVGQAVRLGSDAGDAVRLQAPQEADLNLGGQFTAEAWIYPTQLSGWGRLVMQWDGSGKNSIHFAIRNGSQLSLFHVDENGTQSNVDSPFGTIQLGDALGWQHVAVVGDGEHLRLYHNGAEVSAGPSGVLDVPTPTPYSGTTRPSTADLGLGDSAGIPSAANAFQGLLDEVALWNVALTPEQIASHFEARNAGYGLTPISGETGLRWNSAAITERAEDDDGVQLETFDISDSAHLLQVGTNVLAFHGLNVSATNEDFLLVPQLTATTNVLRRDLQGYFETPTPGEGNPTTFLGLIADIDFSATRGYYDSPIALSLQSDTPDVTIRYTTDGSVPTETNGTAWTAPIVIDTTTTVRAAAFRTGYRPSEVTAHTYVFVDDVLAQPNTAPPGAHWDTVMDPNVVHAAQTHTVRDGLTSLPTLSIAMAPDDLFGSSGIYQNPESRGDAWIRPGSIEFFYPDEYDGYRAGDGFATTSGVRIAGIFSRLTSNPKHSFRLSFRDEFGPGKLDFPLFEDAAQTSFDNLVVLNGHNQSWATGIANALYLRDQVARDLQELAPADAHVNGMFVNLYLNGVYWGQYNLTERPDDQFAAENFGGDKDEYDVLKGVRFGETPLARLVSGTRDAWEAMFAIADRDLSDPANYAEIQQYVDLDQLIDYNIGVLYTGDRDGPTGIVAGQSTPKNFYALRRRTDDGRFRFFAWDAEFTFEDANVDVSEREGSQNPARLHFRLRANPEYRLRFADRVQKWFFNDGPLTPDRVREQFASRAAEIDQSIVAESARWGDSKREPPYTRDIEWANELDRVLNSVITRRSDVVLNQFRADGLYPSVAAPQLAVNGTDQHGGTVQPEDAISLSAEQGTIYYTLDGSDPRVGAALVESLEAVQGNSAATAWVPTGNGLGAEWQQPGFDDTNWAAGSATVGYDRGSDYAGLLGLDLLSPTLPAASRIDTDGNGDNDNNSVYVRVPFAVDDPTSFDTMQLDMTYDDGFVAYLNGHEVARQNAPASPTWDAAAPTARGGAGQVMVAISYGDDNSITIYRNGEVYAPPANTSQGSLRTYAAGTANALIGVRHEDISSGSGSATGADAFFAGEVNEARIYRTNLNAATIADLYATGPLAADSALVSDPQLAHVWSFNEDADDLVGTAHGTLRGGAAISGGRLVLDGVDDFMTSATLNTTISRMTLVAWVSLDNLEQQAGGVLTIENPNGTDIFDAIVYGERTPRQWMAGSNNFQRSVVNNTGAAETVISDQTLVPERFDISEHTDKLQAGPNVLAIHALTHATTAENMLVSPKLTLSQTTSTGVSPTWSFFCARCSGWLCTGCCCCRSYRILY